jgi:hypothetical protein
MTKKPTTTDQLRALMKSHVEVAAVPVIEVPQEPAKPATAKQDTIPAPAIPTPARYSLRLLPSEIAKINSIIKNTVQTISQRVTLTDVLRVGLRRLGESAPLSAAELAALRTTDGRRHESL